MKYVIKREADFDCNYGKSEKLQTWNDFQENRKFYEHLRNKHLIHNATQVSEEVF